LYYSFLYCRITHCISHRATFIAVPPDEKEQSIIAAFLDRETAKIDELIAEQKNLIELLKEK
jgi:type I restriction enzyme S subunit